MKRRDFGLFAGTSLATAVALRPVRAQSSVPDPALLTTTLTPIGAERAGNADGSIPAWTGGVASPALAPDQNAYVRMFTDEQPIYVVDAANMDQYKAMLSPATQYQITKFGLSLKVYPTHRTAALPQYVYDNAAKNVTRAKLDPRGGRLGFTGAYGGPPFPIIDTSDPLAGGAQLIWNHLTSWIGYSSHTLFNPGVVVINGKVALVNGGESRVIYPYYDPNGSLETFEGYFSKLHVWATAPADAEGQETLVWHSTNVNVVPDIVWTLLNGQGRVRKAPNEAFDTPSPEANGIANIDESNCFYGNPSQYDWSYIGKQEMLVPYNCNDLPLSNADELLQPQFLNPEIIRWEKHRVWIVEANLHPGIHNVNKRRRLYIDEDTWCSLLGEGYDADGNMWKAYGIYPACVPAVPGTINQGEIVQDLMTGDYAYNGNYNLPPHMDAWFDGPSAPANFDPVEMAANASF
jgi:hypothetical protein